MIARVRSHRVFSLCRGRERQSSGRMIRVSLLSAGDRRASWPRRRRRAIGPTLGRLPSPRFWLTFRPAFSFACLASFNTSLQFCTRSRLCRHGNMSQPLLHPQHCELKLPPGCAQEPSHPCRRHPLLAPCAPTPGSAQMCSRSAQIRPKADPSWPNEQTLFEAAQIRQNRSRSKRQPKSISNSESLFRRNWTKLGRSSPNLVEAPRSQRPARIGVSVAAPIASEATHVHEGLSLGWAAGRLLRTGGGTVRLLLCRLYSSLLAIYYRAPSRRPPTTGRVLLPAFIGRLRVAANSWPPTTAHLRLAADCWRSVVGRLLLPAYDFPPTHTQLDHTPPSPPHAENKRARGGR